MFYVAKIGQTFISILFLNKIHQCSAGDVTGMAVEEEKTR